MPIKYSEARPHIKTGDVILFKGDRLFQKLIQGWQALRGDTYWYCNHAALVIRSATNEVDDHVYLIETTGKTGLVPRQLSLVYKEHGEPYWLQTDMDGDQRKACYNYAVQKVTEGIPYDFKGCLSNVLGKVSLDISRYYCSEWVWDAHLAAGYVKPHKGNEAPTPSELPVWEGRRPVRLDMNA